MELTDTIRLAQAIDKRLTPELLGRVWTGFGRTPFVLYSGAWEVAVGDGWPSRFKEAGLGVWAATGRDPKLMGNTAITYCARQTAIWDVRTWPDDVDPDVAAAALAHEMFHGHQKEHLHLDWANELLLPSYPHSAQSLGLMLDENRAFLRLMDALSGEGSSQETVLPRLLSEIRSMRRARAGLVGVEYIGYDERIEGIEGTAVYVEAKTKAFLGGMSPARCLGSHARLLEEDDSLPRHHRRRQYVTGALLCLAADALVPGWQDVWPDSGEILPRWVLSNIAREKDTLPRLPSASSVEIGDRLVRKYRKGIDDDIRAFRAKPLLLFEGDVNLLGFDPMNLACQDDVCLHARGMLRIHGIDITIDGAFLAEYEGSIMNVTRLWMSGEADEGSGPIVIHGVGTFNGSTKASPLGLVVRLDGISS